MNVQVSVSVLHLCFSLITRLKSELALQLIAVNHAAASVIITQFKRDILIETSSGEESTFSLTSAVCGCSCLQKCKSSCYTPAPAAQCWYGVFSLWGSPTLNCSSSKNEQGCRQHTLLTPSKLFLQIHPVSSSSTDLKPLPHRLLCCFYDSSLHWGTSQMKWLNINC